jgi:predicted ester cyclase
MTGEFMGIPLTKRSFSMQFIDILEIHEGKATAHWGVTDQAAMMQQLGLVPDM